MGVRREDFIVIGANIGMTHYDDDKYEEYDEFRSKDDIGEMTYIIDGMSGDYFIVGEVVRYGDDYNGFGNHEIEMSEESAQRVTDFIEIKFGITVTPKLLVVTHFH